MFKRKSNIFAYQTAKQNITRERKKKVIILTTFACEAGKYCEDKIWFMSSFPFQIPVILNNQKKTPVGARRKKKRPSRIRVKQRPFEFEECLSLA